MKQPSRRRQCQQVADAHATGGLAEDGDIAGITAEMRDVVAHPGQRLDLIEQPLIAGGRDATVRHRGQRREAQDSQPIVDGDHHHIAVASEGSALVDTLGARADGEAAAVDPHHYRSFAGTPGRPDIEGQAVLGLGTGFGAHDVVQRALVLGRPVAELPRIPNPGPGQRVRRRQPASLADRRRGIGNALEYQHAALFVTLQLAAADLDDRCRCRATHGDAPGLQG